MPYIHTTHFEDAIQNPQRSLQEGPRPNNDRRLHIMDVHLHKSQSLRDELREHSRYIRDTLAPLLAREPELSKSDDVLLRSIFKRLESLHLNLDLLRYSRIEKALMVIAATGTSTWPMDLVGRAEELIQKWEDKLGPLKNLRSDPYAPGGRLEGLIKIGKSNQDDVCLAT